MAGENASETGSVLTQPTGNFERLLGKEAIKFRGFANGRHRRRDDDSLLLVGTSFRLETFHLINSEASPPKTPEEINN